jgi:hypothetical protein
MVTVLDTNKEPLATVHPRQARWLLDQGKASVYRMDPFTIILKQVVGYRQTRKDLFNTYGANSKQSTR